MHAKGEAEPTSEVFLAAMARLQSLRINYALAPSIGVNTNHSQP
jgi:hypothetical protein